MAAKTPLSDVENDVVGRMFVLAAWAAELRCASATYLHRARWELAAIPPQVRSALLARWGDRSDAVAALTDADQVPQRRRLRAELLSAPRDEFHRFVQSTVSHAEIVVVAGAEHSPSKYDLESLVGALLMVGAADCGNLRYERIEMWCLESATEATVAQLAHELRLGSHPDADDIVSLAALTDVSGDGPDWNAFRRAVYPRDGLRRYLEAGVPGFCEWWSEGLRSAPASASPPASSWPNAVLDAQVSRAKIDAWNADTRRLQEQANNDWKRHGQGW